MECGKRDKIAFQHTVIINVGRLDVLALGAPWSDLAPPSLGTIFAGLSLKIVDIVVRRGRDTHLYQSVGDLTRRPLTKSPPSGKVK